MLADPSSNKRHNDNDNYTDMKGSGHILGSDQIRHICA